MTKLLVIIAGPTASGKTSLGVEIALHYKTEIISADSRQFYRELTIGTAKPSAGELALVPHHFINSHSIEHPVTAGMYGIQARQLIEQLFTKNDVVVMVGGSGLYINAVIYGIDDLPADERIREELNDIFKLKGLPALQALLKEKDPATYSRIDVLNPRRLIRALEVTLITGKTYSSQLRNQPQPFPWEWIMAGIEWPRKELYERINKRVDAMITAGLKTETESVMQFRNKNALSTVGYKEMFEHLDHKISLEETALLIAQHTRNYAKRQLTWFKRYPGMVWLKPGSAGQVIELIDNKISRGSD